MARPKANSSTVGAEKALIEVPLDTLTEDPENARTHPDSNMAAIKRSLTEFGQVEPLVVQSSSGRVIGGNGRLRAMRELGWSSAKVVVVDMTDTRAKALAIALNRTAELAQWDFSRLAETLAKLDASLVEVAGFSADELATLIGSMDYEGVPDPETPEPDDEEKEGNPIRLSKEQRERFDDAATRVRERMGVELTDGAVVAILADLEPSE